jgi:hypothetical protein
VDEKPGATGFVSLKSVKQGSPDGASALADIRRIYFETTKQTIENDLVHAIELLKSLPTEAEREKAVVFMEGLAQMRREWTSRGRGGAARTGAKTGKKAAPGKPPTPRTRRKDGS